MTETASSFVPWLRALAKDGGKGVVGNIDARCLGRLADGIDDLSRQLAEAQTISKQRLSALEFVRSERDKLHHKLAEAQRVIERQRIVTDEMIAAGAQAIDDYYNGTKDAPFEGSVKACYLAMHSAAMGTKK